MEPIRIAKLDTGDFVRYDLCSSENRTHVNFDYLGTGFIHSIDGIEQGITQNTADVLFGGSIPPQNICHFFKRMEKKKRGGSMPGAGRKPTGRLRPNFTTTLNVETVEYLKGIEPGAGRLIDRLVEEWLETLTKTT